MTDLHAAIMSLPARPKDADVPATTPDTTGNLLLWLDGYAAGHRDAREAAMQLVYASQTESSPLIAQAVAAAEDLHALSEGRPPKTAVGQAAAAKLAAIIPRNAP